MTHSRSTRFVKSTDGKEVKRVQQQELADYTSTGKWKAISETQYDQLKTKLDNEQDSNEKG